MDPAYKTLTLTVPNGTLNRHQQQQQQAVYRECLKNHAASLGGHSLDGCGEFMASPSSDLSDPTSLRCAACGCHRNFHRRLPFFSVSSSSQPLLQHHHHHRQEDDYNNNNENEGDEEEEEDGSEDDHRYDDADGEIGDNNNIKSNHYGINNSSVPHMLIALSTAAAGTTPQQQQQQQQQEEQDGQRSRKRFRTRFSPEQKERMQELSERLGWRMQKRDEGLVEDRCREIGVGKGVFKVWMHNNKHNFVPRSPSSATLAPSVLPPLTSSLAIPTVSAMSTLGGGDGGTVNGVGNVRVNGPGSASAS